MKDIKIAGSKWQKQHWKSIESSYNKSPWFEFYKDELAAIYERPCSFLLDWNLTCFEWAIKKLNFSTKISLTETYHKNYPEDVVDYRNKILPRNYKDYPSVFYHQVFEHKSGFLPNLSIIDLLFCEGKNAGNLLAG